MATVDGVVMGIKDKLIRLKEEVKTTNEKHDSDCMERERSKRRYLEFCSQRTHLQRSVEDINERLTKVEQRKKETDKRLYEKQLYLTSLEEFVTRMNQSQIEDSVDEKRKNLQQSKHKQKDLLEKIAGKRSRVQKLEAKLEKTEQRMQKRRGLINQLEEKKAFLTGELRFRKGKYDQVIGRNEDFEEKAKDLAAAIAKRQREAELFAAQVNSIEKRIDDKEKQLQKYQQHNSKLETSVRELLPCYMLAKQTTNSSNNTAS